MGFFNFPKLPDIDQGVKDYQSTPGAILVDVRTPQEYRDGHIPGSKNVPLQALNLISTVAENKQAPLFVYCYSGGRSRQATNALQRMGYSRVTDIGGIVTYSGKVEV